MDSERYELGTSPPTENSCEDAQYLYFILIESFGVPNYAGHLAKNIFSRVSKL